jgi:hypothetical protein
MLGLTCLDLSRPVPTCPDAFDRDAFDRDAFDPDAIVNFRLMFL